MLRRCLVCVGPQSLSCVQCFVTPRTVAYQSPLSMGFSMQECYSGLPFPPPGDLPDPGIEPTSPDLQADSLPLGHLGSPKCPVDVSNHHYYHPDDQIKGVFKDPGDLENP